MASGIRLVAECYDLKTGKIIDSKELRQDTLKKPQTLEEFGYLHGEQIQLLQSIQDFKLCYETKLINDDVLCPACGNKTNSRGTKKSNFHAALTDHVINIQQRRCHCGWKSDGTVAGIYGSALHPDLVEKQAIQGVDGSYRKASRTLNAESKSKRCINNDDRIRRNVAQVAKLVEAEKLKDVRATPIKNASKELVVVADGGHLKSKDQDSRSFEAMIATVYRPENIRRIDKNHNEVIQKTSIASALSDEQVTIKKLVLNACRKEGMNAKVTELTCLTDGAANCWSITNSLKFACKKLTNVLDWFHITKRFTIINNRIDSDMQERLEKVKWFLWHGKSQEALKRLLEIKNTTVASEKLFSDLEELHDYLERNQGYMVNYQKRKIAKLPFTSSYAESSVNTVINARQKNDKKMQWTREGAHNILQIRTSLFSKTWKADWKKTKNKMYPKAA